MVDHVRLQILLHLLVEVEAVVVHVRARLVGVALRGLLRVEAADAPLAGDEAGPVVDVAQVVDHLLDALDRD